MISISTNKANDIAKAITGLTLADKEIKKAFYTALGRTVIRVKNRLAKDIADETAIPLKVIRKRLLLYKKQQNKEQKIWAGLNDIPLHYLGNPKQVGEDVVVKGIKADDAYISGKHVKLRFSEEVATYKVSGNIDSLINQRLPYYLDVEFQKNFEQILRYKFK